jgi:hypothetical protein
LNILFVARQIRQLKMLNGGSVGDCTPDWAAAYFVQFSDFGLPLGLFLGLFLNIFLDIFVYFK